MAMAIPKAETLWLNVNRNCELEAIAQSIYSGWLPTENSMVDLSSSRTVNVYQRVNLHFPMGFPMFSHFPMFSYGFSYCAWKSPLGITAVELRRSKPHLGIGTSHRFGSVSSRSPKTNGVRLGKNADFYVPNKDLFVGTRPCHQAEIDIFSFHLPSHKHVGMENPSFSGVT